MLQAEPGPLLPPPTANAEGTEEATSPNLAHPPSGLGYRAQDQFSREAILEGSWRLI